MRKCVPFLLSVILISCGSKPDDKGPVKDVSSSRLAGRVQTVNKTSGFVLIRRYGPWRKVGEQEIVESRAEGRTANLLPTGEKLGEHIAADIRSGEVEVGDAVYVRKIALPETSKVPEQSSEVKNQE